MQGAVSIINRENETPFQDKKDKKDEIMAQIDK